MHIWTHVLLNLLALASLLLMPYVFLTLGLLVTYGWTTLRNRLRHANPAHGGRA